jgi:hypothetical protein
MDIGYIDESAGKEWLQETRELSLMLGSLIKTKKGFLTK